VYGGNSNYGGSDSGCEKFIVEIGRASSRETVKDGTATVDNTTHASLGDQTHDTSSVSGQVGTFSLAGTVTYNFYSSNDCSGTPTTSNGSVGAAGSVADTALSAALAAGGYSSKAVYGGNSNYGGSDSGCEKFIV